MSVTTTISLFTDIRKKVLLLHHSICVYQIDRFNLVKDAIMHLPQLGNKGSFLIQKMNDKLVEHKQYIAEYGQDLEEIRNWEWHK